MKWQTAFRISLLTNFLLMLVNLAPAQKNKLTITFINSINKSPVILDSISYKNCWNENFTISKLKYYISNIQLKTTLNNIESEEDSYHLIDEADTASKSFSFYVPAATFSSLSFLIGVDSLKNVSGAQINALDPLNAMFWTWNTGYIMFKLEGNSPQSTSINNKIEYHIGGFCGINKVLRKVYLKLIDLNPSIKKKGSTEIIIGVDIGKIWDAQHNISISNTPVCATPSALAATIADNYIKGFEIIKIIQH